MGSRPSSRRRGELSNGSIGNETETDLRAENAKLIAKIAELEQGHVPGNIREENDKLREENEGLKRQLKGRSQSHSLPQWQNQGDTLQVRENKSLNDFRLSDQVEQAADPLQRTKSDTTNNYVDRVETLGPSLHKQSKQPRKIKPTSVPTRMSDIEAYGKGLPLPNTERLRNNIRRTRKKKLRTDSGNSTGSSVEPPTDDPNRNEIIANSSPERTDQQDVFLGVDNFNSGADDSDRSTSEAKDDLLM